MEDNILINSLRNVLHLFIAQFLRVTYLFGKEFLVLFIMFFFIYPTNFNFLPFPTDRLLQVLGFCVVFISVLLTKDVKIPLKLIYYFGLILFLSVYTFFPLFWSADKNTYLVKKIFDGALAGFSCYFVVKVFHKLKGRITIGLFLDYIIYAVVVQSVISFYLFFNPDIYVAFLSLTRAGENDIFMSRVGLIDLRLMGISNSLFTASINYGVHFLLILILPYTESKIAKVPLLHFFFILIIAAAGVFSGRTVFAGIALGLCMYFFLNFSNVKFILKTVIKVLITFTLLVIFSIPILEKYIDVSEFERTLNWTFEIFNNYSESGSLSSSSSDIMLDMYVAPNNFFTWLFGDGQIVMTDGTYYMETDIGYIRLLFYFGLIGVLLFFVIKYMLMKVVAKLYHYEIRVLLLFLFFWALILNFKGLANLNFYFTLFFVLGMYLNKNRVIE